MKEILIACMFMLTSVFANAEIPKKIKVYVQYSGVIPVGLSMVEAYNRIYNASAVVIPKAGAGGLIALQEAIHEKDFVMICGTGATDAVLYKVNVAEHFHQVYQEIKLINIMAFTGIYFITGNNNPHNTLKRLLNSSTTNKPILVGFEGLGSKSIASKIIGKTPVTWVQYRQPGDGAGSLNLGELDLFVGGLNPLLGLAEAGKLKMLGHINVDTVVANSIGPNLASDYPEAVGVANFLGMSSLKSYSQEDLTEMNKRINNVLTTTEVQEIFNKANYKIIKPIKIENIPNHLLKYDSLLVK